MKVIIIILSFSLFLLMLGYLIQCSDSGSPCVKQGYLCEQYAEIYYRCEEHQYYTDPYGHQDVLYVYIWYKITDGDEQVVWHSFQKMRDFYCQDTDDEDDVVLY